MRDGAAYGKPGGGCEGYVDRLCTIDDAEAFEVSGDGAFARDFFGRYIRGHEVADYARLLAQAGAAVRKRNAGRAWLGDLHLDSSGGRVASLVAPTWPAYTAGIDQDDVLQQLDGQRVTGDADIASVLARHKPGDTVSIAFADRSGASRTARVTLGEDPHVEVVPAEQGGTLTPAQRVFRDRWLGAK